MNLTKSQSEVMDLISKYGEDNTRLFILWYGGIRAGKTYGMVRAGVEHSLSRENVNYIVGGFTLRSIINNIAPYFKEICADLGLKYKLVSGGINPRVDVGSNSFLFYGGDRLGRDQNVQGATASGLLIDEFELLNREFVKQCEGRISQAGALRIYTSNKGQPYSWAKREYYDRVIEGELDAILIDSNPDENNFIDGEFLDEKIAEYDDYHRRRFIENEFTLKLEPLYSPDMIECIDNYEVNLTILYSYGRHHFTIPMLKETDGEIWVIGDIEYLDSPVDAKVLSRYGTILVNSTASRLGRELITKRYNIRGYSDMFMPHKVELSQRAFGYGKVKVFEGAKNTVEAIDTYAFPSVNETPEITAIESGIEYLARMYRWE